MPRVTITQIHEQEPPPFGPCKFEPDGRKISRDLCVVRSGDLRLNTQCGNCLSPYRMCRERWPTNTICRTGVGRAYGFQPEAETGTESEITGRPTPCAAVRPLVGG